MKKGFLLFLIVTSFCFCSFADKLYYCPAIPQYSGTTYSFKNHKVGTNDFVTVQLGVANYSHGVRIDSRTGYPYSFGNIDLTTTQSQYNYIVSCDTGLYITGYQCTTLNTLDSVCYNLWLNGFSSSNIVFQAKSGDFVYFNILSLAALSEALCSTNTFFRSQVLNGLSSLSSDVRQLVLDSSSALSSLSSIDSRLSSISDTVSSLSSIETNSFRSASSLSSIETNSFRSASSLSSIETNSFRSASSLSSIETNSFRSASSLSSIDSASTGLASTFSFLNPSSYNTDAPPWVTGFEELTDHFSYGGRAPWFDQVLPYVTDDYLKYRSGVVDDVFSYRINKYNDAVSSIPPEELRGKPASFFEELFNNPSLQDQLIANFRYNTPISTNMLNIVTNHVERPLTNSIQQAAAAVTNELSNGTQAITNDLSDIKDILGSMISNNHVIVDNELDHPVPVTISGDMGFNLTIEDAQIFGEALLSPALSNMLSSVTNLLGDLAGFVTNELLHIHYNDFYGGDGAPFSPSDSLSSVLDSYGIKMNTELGYWSFVHGATHLQSEFIAFLLSSYSEVTNLNSVSSWFEDEETHETLSFSKVASNVLSSFPSKTQLIDYIDHSTNSVSQISTNEIVSLISSFTNSFNEAVSVFGSDYSPPTADLVLFRYNDYDFTVPVGELSTLWYFIHNFMAFAICLVNLVLLPRFVLVVVRRFMRVFSHSLSYLNSASS